MDADNQGLRFNEGKPRYDLVPPEAMDAIADHYRKGAEKYADRNWERGMNWGKCFASLMRHAWAWMRGEDIDAETGSHHMVAVAWNAIALYVYYSRQIGKDDRPKYVQSRGSTEAREAFEEKYNGPRTTEAVVPATSGFIKTFWPPEAEG